MLKVLITTMRTTNITTWTAIFVAVGLMVVSLRSGKAFKNACRLDAISSV
jgi:hypothetical protein